MLSKGGPPRYSSTCRSRVRARTAFIRSTSKPVVVPFGILDSAGRHKGSLIPTTNLPVDRIASGYGWLRSPLDLLPSGRGETRLRGAGSGWADSASGVTRLRMPPAGRELPGDQRGGPGSQRSAAPASARMRVLGPTAAPDGPGPRGAQRWCAGGRTLQDPRLAAFGEALPRTGIALSGSFAIPFAITSSKTLWPAPGLFVVGSAAGGATR